MGDMLGLSIPIDIRTPGQYLEIDTSRAVGTLPVQQRRLLVIGQRLTTGTVAAGVPTLITRAAQAETFFGRGSMLARMCSALFGTVGQYREIWACALDDAVGSTVSTRTITIGGTVTGAGTLTLYIAGVRVAIAVPAAQAAATTAAALAAAVNAQSDLPMTASAAAAVVTLTARNKGECGGGIDVRWNYYVGDAMPAGLTCGVTGSFSGSGTADVTVALAAIDGQDYYSIVLPWPDAAALAAVEADLATRWGPLDGHPAHAFAALDASHAGLIAAGDLRNSPHVTIMGLYNSPTWAPERAAILAGVCEYYGAIDPARPLQTLALPGILAPAVADRFTRTERDLLLHHGISTVTHGSDGLTSIERVITTYRQTAAGVSDTSLLDLETKWTVDYIRYAVRVRIATRFPRHKLANDGTQYAAGQAIVTPRLIRAELIALMRDLEQAGLVEDLDQFVADLQVVRSASDPNRIDAIIPPNVVNQFRVFAAAVQFRL